MRSKTIGFILKIPAILLLIAAFIGGIYASIKHIQGIGFSVPVVIGVIIVLYIFGEYFQNKKASM